MSVLAYPRVHFRGKCRINPPTGNNNDVRVNIDDVNVSLRPELARLTDEQIRSWLFGSIPALSRINGGLFTYLRSGWNPYGDGSTDFRDLIVCSVVGDAGKIDGSDPIIGRPLRLVGSGGSSPVICDVDPSGSAVTQLFVGGLSLGDGAIGMSAEYDTRAYSRWIIFRNASVYPGEQNYVGAGATWQFAIPGDALEFRQPSASPILARLEAAARSSRGILVQFCFYLPEPGITDGDLAVLLRYGCGRGNPAEAFVVGTIGVWEAGDLMTVPNGRLLLAPPAGEDPLQNPPLFPSPLGPAVARVQPDRPVVSLDLISTFPEANYDRPPSRKAYIGPVRLGLIPASGGPPVPLGEPLAYGYASYERTAGIVDVPYDPAVATADQLRDGSLVLLADCYPQGPILTEAYSSLTVETDDRAVYLDVGESREIAVLVLQRGRPPAEDVTIFLWEYRYVADPGGLLARAFSTLERSGPGTPRDHRIAYPATVVFPKGRATPLPIGITAIRPGPLVLAFTFDGEPPDDGLPSAGSHYAGIRVMPQDDFSSVRRDRRLSWEFMYDTLFRYYHLIFPAMSLVIPFDDRDAVTKAAREGKLTQATDPTLWHSTRYMPPTRDLSAGKRKLLVEWAAHVAGTSGP